MSVMKTATATRWERMITVGDRLGRWAGLLDGLRARVWWVAVPRSVPGKAGVVVAGLVWVPGFLLAKTAVVTFSDALFWQEVPLSAALRVGYLHGWGLTLVRAEPGVPALALVSTGGLGLALGWAAVARTGRWVLASVAAVLSTPFVALTCWVLTVDPDVPWWWTVQRCLGPGFVWSVPLWGICFWAYSEKLRDRWGWWPVAGWLGLSGAGCVLAMAAIVNAMIALGGLPSLTGG